MAVLNRFETLLRLKQAAEDRNITLTDMAKEIKISRDTLSRYAGQKITMYDSKIVDTICRYFGVEVGEFLYLEPAIKSKEDIQSQ